MCRLNAEDTILQFQKGKLSEADQEWHMLVPSEARDALGKREVQRQSVIFEVFKSEREYVSDLEAVLEVGGIFNGSSAGLTLIVIGVY